MQKDFNTSLLILLNEGSQRIPEFVMSAEGVERIDAMLRCSSLSSRSVVDAAFGDASELERASYNRQGSGKSKVSQDSSQGVRRCSKVSQDSYAVYQTCTICVQNSRIAHFTSAVRQTESMASVSVEHKSKSRSPEEHLEISERSKQRQETPQMLQPRVAKESQITHAENTESDASIIVSGAHRGSPADTVVDTGVMVSGGYGGSAADTAVAI